jgi:hypothetical protein
VTEKAGAKSQTFNRAWVCDFAPAFSVIAPAGSAGRPVARFSHCSWFRGFVFRGFVVSQFRAPN